MAYSLNTDCAVKQFKTIFVKKYLIRLFSVMTFTNTFLGK
jgi:hypothetical protein